MIESHKRAIVTVIQRDILHASVFNGQVTGAQEDLKLFQWWAIIVRRLFDQGVMDTGVIVSYMMMMRIMSYTLIWWIVCTKMMVNEECLSVCL